MDDGSGSAGPRDPYDSYGSYADDGYADEKGMQRHVRDAGCSPCPGMGALAAGAVAGPGLWILEAFCRGPVLQAGQSAPDSRASRGLRLLGRECTAAGLVGDRQHLCLWIYSRAEGGQLQRHFSRIAARLQLGRTGSAVQSRSPAVLAAGGAPLRLQQGSTLQDCRGLPGLQGPAWC